MDMLICIPGNMGFKYLLPVVAFHFMWGFGDQMLSSGGTIAVSFFLYGSVFCILCKKSFMVLCNTQDLEIFSSCILNVLKYWFSHLYF